MIVQAWKFASRLVFGSWIQIQQKTITLPWNAMFSCLVVDLILDSDCQLYFPGNTNFFPLFVHFGQWKIISPSNTIVKLFFNLLALFYNRISYPSIWKFSIVNISFKISKKKFLLCRDKICKESVRWLQNQNFTVN